MASKKPTASIVLQDRDILVLRDLFECRVMTAAHIADIRFEGRREMAKKRLQKLKAWKLIKARRRAQTEAATLSLALNGLVTLQKCGVLAEYPEFDLPALERRSQVSPLTLAHELEVMDVKAAFHVSAARSKLLSIPEFSTWPLLNEFTSFRTDGSEVVVKPDGFIRLHEKEGSDGLSEHTFFLEIDRSTEIRDRLALRAGYYLEYYKSGGFAERHGAPRTAFKDYPFRVLMVFKSAEPRNNMAERLLQNTPPIFTQVFLTTLAEVTSDPLGAIWIRPVDYRDSLSGSPFGLKATRERAYQRQTAREVFVEKHVKKHSLIAGEESAVAKKSDP